MTALPPQDALPKLVEDLAQLLVVLNDRCMQTERLETTLAAQVGELEQRLQRGLREGIDRRTARLEQVWTEAAVELQRRRKRWLWLWVESMLVAVVLVVLGMQGYGMVRWRYPQPVLSEVQRQWAGFGEEMDGYLRETLYPLLNERRRGEIDAICSRHGLQLLGE